MKFLSLCNFLLMITLLTACSSPELILRHSKVKKYTTLVDTSTQEALALTLTPSKIPNTISPTNTVQSTNPSDDSSSAVAEKKLIIPEEKLLFKQKQYKQRADQNLKHVIQSTYQQAKAVAHKQKQKVNGIFSGIGNVFKVVGLVFIVVGIILFLIGGIIIDTLGAVCLGFGLLFLLIWLVLIILQGVFDVIL